MIKKGDTVAVCLSGGADSMALFHLLYSEKENLGINILVLHVNHGLREESRQEEIFVRDYCQTLGAECRIYRAKMGEKPLPQGMSTEMRARNERYGFFTSSIGNTGTLLATAHTASDRRETVLFNITRGSSIRGAAGIPPVRDYVIRPLIECTRRDTERYCELNGIPFVNDRTNFQTDYSRNRIRLKVIPELIQVNSRAVSNINFFASESREIYTLLTQLSDKLYDESFSCGSFDTSLLIRAHPAVTKNLLRNYLEKNGCLSRDGVEAVFSHLCGGGGQLSKNLYFRVRNGRLWFYGAETSLETTEPVAVCPPCEVCFAQKIFSFSFVDYSRYKEILAEGKNCFTNAVDCDKIKDSILLRRRKPGDKITLPRRNVTKTLKKLFSEDGIPPEKRAKTAVLSDSRGNVLWVSGYGADRHFLPGKGSAKILIISEEKENAEGQNAGRCGKYSDK